MRDFWSHSPTRVEFGAGKVKMLAEVVSGYRRPLNIMGSRGVHRPHPLWRLAPGGLCWDGVSSNPRLSHAEAGVKAARDMNCDCVVAIGGGSVIDEAKIIAAGAVNDKPLWHWFTSGEKIASALPIIAVPTIASTGSEVNGGCVLTNEATGEKTGIGSPALYPRLAILDPELTVTVPRHLIACGLIDAFSHCLEPYLNAEMFPVVQDNMAEAVMRAIIEIAPRVLSNPKDIEARGDAMWATCCAHDGRLNLGRGKVRYEIHDEAHMMGTKFDLHHGLAIAITLTRWMRENLPQRRDRLAKLGERVFGVHRADPQSAAEACLKRMADWIMGMEILPEAAA